MWIYQSKQWPNFTWDNKKLIPILSDVRYKQGLLLGRIIDLGFDIKKSATLETLTNDVIKTSAIEGENLPLSEVRSSVAKRLGIEIAGVVSSSRNVDGIVEIMLDATQNYTKPLTKDRLYGWHSALFPSGRSGMHKITVGNWRLPESDPMQVVSGSIGKEKIHFQAPAASELCKEISKFLHWYENENCLDPVIKAGIAHLWFVTIHPFEDGNGRITRAIADMALCRADGIGDRFYSMSSQIEAERKEYYKILELQQRSSTDITTWLEWFFNCLGRAISRAETTLDRIWYKSRLWTKISRLTINERQRNVISRVLDDNFEGFISTSKYAKLTKCSTDTALRDIQDLKSKGLLLQNANAGRSTSYRLPDEVN